MNQIRRIIVFTLLDNIVLFIGAVVFMYTEYHYMMVQPKKNSTLLKTEIETMVGIKLNESQFKFIVQHVEGHTHNKDPGKAAKYVSTWKKTINTRTFIRWCYFAYTILTTIGYGDVYVESTAGKLFLNVYAFVAIPFHLYTSYLIGRAINYVLAKLLFFIELKLLHRTTVEYRSSKLLFMTIIVGILWILICAVLIIKSEGWNMIDAVYFSVVSMLTIGFGDLTMDIFELAPIQVFLAIHLYIGTSLLASVVNGIADFMKKEDKREKYSLSRKRYSFHSKDDAICMTKSSFPNLAFKATQNGE